MQWRTPGRSRYVLTNVLLLASALIVQYYTTNTADAGPLQYLCVINEPLDLHIFTVISKPEAVGSELILASWQVLPAPNPCG